MRSYPEPPWHLRGSAVSLPVLLDRERVRLPAGLSGAGAAGFRVGVLVLASYGTGSTLEYREAAVLAVARRGRRFGAYVHWIRVDDDASIAGGRQVWGLPKARAEFRWIGPPASPTVEVGAADGFMVAVAARGAGLAPPLPVRTRLRVFVERSGEIVDFAVRIRGRARLALVRASTGSAELGVRRPLGAPAFVWTRLDATVQPPSGFDDRLRAGYVGSQ